MVQHVFYIPTSYAALIYGLLAGTGLLLALFVAGSMHRREILSSACGEDHYEFWPSISASVGDMLPERQIWRSSFILCVPFRLATAISLMFVFWQRGCNGMSDIYAMRNSGQWRQLLSSNAFLVLIMLWTDLWRLIGTVIWTMVASSESLGYHNLGFCPYVFLCFVLQVVTTILVRRCKHNLRIYPTQRDGERSYKLKRICVWGEGIMSVGVVVFFLRHAATCAPGSFSLSTMCEWCFAVFNIGFDVTTWYDLKMDGWWLSTSPTFFRDLFRRARVAGHTGGVKSAEITSAASGHAMMDGPGTAAVSIGREGGEKEEEADDMQGDKFIDEPAAAPAPTDSTGEFFLTKDIILHRFTFCSAPSRLTMWLCDIYWAHLLLESMVHLVEHMYFMPLIAMSLSWEISSVMVFGAPCLLRISAFRRWATGPCFGAKTWLAPNSLPRGLSYRSPPMYLFFYLCGALSHFHIHIQHSAGNKILAVAFGSFFFSLAFFTRFLYPSCATRKKGWTESNEESRRLMYSFPLSVVLCMLLRILYVSQSPFYVEPFYAGLFGVVLGIAFTTIIYRHVMFGDVFAETVPHSGIGATTTTASATQDAEMALRGAKGMGEGHAQASSTTSTGPSPKLTQSRAEELAPNTIAALGTAYPRPRPALLGCVFGASIGMILNIFISPGYIPRLVAIDPFPTSLIVTACYACGVIFSTDVLPICPSILRSRSPSGNGVGAALRKLFGGSPKRFSIVMVASLLVLTHATRQTNFTVESRGPHYPASFSMKEEEVTIKDWTVQDNFWGSKHLALGGGLVLAFCFGVLMPVVCELCLCHQRARRFAAVAESYDPEIVYRGETTYFSSFEMLTLVMTIFISVLYALVVSYPFVPMAWIVRERSRLIMFLHLVGLLGAVVMILGRVRKVNAGIVFDFFTARKQRTVQFMVRLLIAVAFIWVFIGRVSMQPGSIGFPAGKTTAVDFPKEVLHLHKMLIDMRVQRNGMTDPDMKKFEKEFHHIRFEETLAEMGRNITEAEKVTEVDPRFGLSAIESKQDRDDIWEAAKAMTFFSGMIWTVHFGLDNYDVDSLWRMSKHASKTEAGVVGLLESDSMHLTNGNRDMVEYMSYYMGFPYTDYGPTTLDNTYGCALISRYPIRKVHRYVAPSPLGELACVIHAELDVFGLFIHTYVGHFGNTEHWVDGLLQSQFLGQLAEQNVGMSMWLGYLVTYPGNPSRYHRYTDPVKPGKFRDAGLEMYTQHPWVRLSERGGYEELPPSTVTSAPGESVDFNVEFKIPLAAHLEVSVAHPDVSFRRPPADKPNRYFYYNDTNRYTVAHPRFEFLDRYCQYSFYKSGRAEDELPDAKMPENAPFVAELFDWWRIVDQGVENMSDTEIQVIQLRFVPRN